jgi:hypothetical protein
MRNALEQKQPKREQSSTELGLKARKMHPQYNKVHLTKAITTAAHCTIGNRASFHGVLECKIVL